MTHPDDFKVTYKKRKPKPKHTVMWTVYHTILAVELLIIIIIEGIELYGQIINGQL
jgi:hypothetical protein